MLTDLNICISMPNRDHFKPRVTYHVAASFFTQRQCLNHEIRAAISGNLMARKAKEYKKEKGAY